MMWDLLLAQFELPKEPTTAPLVQEESFTPFYDDPKLFLSAIKQKEKETRAVPGVTGITVPHHLLASDLMAETFLRARRANPKLIVLLSPDHYYEGKTVFSTTPNDFETVFGPVKVAQAQVAQIQKELPIVHTSTLFRKEHGTHSLTPFIAYFFPEVPILPIAVRIDASKGEVDQLVEKLKILLPKEQVLIIQSTDFSHYLPHTEAKKKDQETLRTLMYGTDEELLSLTQPAHLDSLMLQYIQRRLQREHFHAEGQIIENKNSQEYTKEPVQETTSYITQLYTKHHEVMKRPPEQKRYIFLGDTFTGRYMKQVLENKAVKARLIRRMQRVTHNATVLVNFEGVLQEQCPEKSGVYVLCMEQKETLALLHALGVDGVNLANNHTKDFGEEGYQKTKQILEEAGLLVLEPFETTPLSSFCLVTLSDVENSAEKKKGLLYATDIQKTIGTGQCPNGPLFAWMHWGEEGTIVPSAREIALEKLLGEQGVELVVGSHTHRASSLQCTKAFCRIYSLGNFLFDQLPQDASGTLLEVTFFVQGTYTLRTIPMATLIGNYPHYLPTRS